MSLLGMGSMEVLVILLVGFIFLGPERLVSGGRTLGKFMNQVRGMAGDMTNMVAEAEEGEPSATRQGARDHPPTKDTGRGQTTAQAQSTTESGEEDGPVPFRRTQAPPPEEGAEPRRRVRTH
jgi:Sec-independent protein translocase protein TatA